VLMLRADAAGYEELGRVRLFEDEVCWTAPTLNRGRLFVRGPTRAACLWLGRPAMVAGGSQTAGQSRMATGGADGSLVRQIAVRREDPFATPRPQELAAWYVAVVLGAFVPATLVAVVAAIAIMGRRRELPKRAAVGVLFWVAVLAAALAGTPVYSQVFDRFLFTWPAALFALHQLVLGTLIWARRRHGTVRGRWAATLAALAFLAGCAGYCFLCRELRMIDGLAFLLGLLPSWPLAVPAARRILRQPGIAGPLIWGWLAFSLFFWAGGAVIAWRWLSSAA